VTVTSDEVPRRLPLGERIRICMERGRPNRDVPWSLQQVCSAMAEHGVSITPSYLSNLRRGGRTEPSSTVLRGLAKVFDVHWTYFMADDEEAAAAERQLRRLEEAGRAANSAAVSLGSYGQSAEGGQLSLAERLERCFQVMHPRDRDAFTNKEVAEGLQSHGVQVSEQYVHMLRTGARDNPTIGVLRALSHFFFVPPTYFLGSDREIEEIDAQLAYLQAVRSPEARDFILRAGEATPETLRAVAHLLTMHSPRDDDSTGSGPREHPHA